ncbi:MAG: response regulator [Actinobacteria bacterium]|nr:response regulator [Actinomycetota bacterium]
MTDPVRVLVADDHPSARAGVRAALEEHGDFVICAEVGDTRSAVEAALNERPDICLVDVHMPGGGIRAAEQISDRLPDTTVMMLTVSDADVDLFDSLRAGAAGYLLKDTRPDRLPVALKAALRGEGVLPRRLVGTMVEEFRERGRRRVQLRDRRVAGLTSRERQVLDLLAADLTTAQIAERLFISPITVRRHIADILKKLRVDDRAAAIKLLKRA